MTDNGESAVKSSLLYLFREAFDGPGPKDGLFLNAGAGIRGVLDDIDSDTASVLVNGSSIAAHASHLRLYLEVISSFVKGIARSADWNEGWSVTSVTEPEWDGVREGIAAACRDIEETVAGIRIWDEDKISMVMALTVHSAYHLGAIKQMIKSL